MDQGFAAVVAGAMGLVGALGGALAGGYGAVRGAREGADRAAQAAMEQLRRQSRDQHEQWLRQERRLVFSQTNRHVMEFVKEGASAVRKFRDPHLDADGARQVYEALRATGMTMFMSVQDAGLISGVELSQARHRVVVLADAALDTTRRVVRGLTTTGDPMNDSVNAALGAVSVDALVSAMEEFQSAAADLSTRMSEVVQRID